MREAIIKDYPAYKIREDGKVFSKFKPKAGIIWDKWVEVKPVLDKGNGYLLVTLCSGDGKRQNKRIHRLLMEAFVPNPNNYPHINHIDGIKTNNNLSNLEWCTCKYNTQEAIRLGLANPKEQSSIIAVNQLDKVTKEVIATYISIHDAGRSTNIAWQNIWKVCNGRRKTAGGFAWEYKESSETIS